MRRQTTNTHTQTHTHKHTHKPPFLLQITNFLQNTVNLCQTGLSPPNANVTSIPWRGLLNVCQPCFAVLFGLARLVAGPPVCLYFVYVFGYENGGERVPYWFGVVWTVVAVAMVHGSLPFAIKNLRESFGADEKKRKKK